MTIELKDFNEDIICQESILCKAAEQEKKLAPKAALRQDKLLYHLSLLNLQLL